MAVDSWALLKWMAEREDLESGQPTLWGSEFLNRAAAKQAEAGQSWDAIARATAHLKRRRYVDWRYVPMPNVDPPEPPLEHVGSSFLQRVQEIHVTAEGRAALAAREAPAATQVNIVNSTVGQLALGDIANINIFVVLDAMERSLDSVEAPIEAKEEARGAIQRMRDAGGGVATSAAGSVLAAALRQAFGLP